MKGSSQHTFARVPSVDIPRSKFLRNWTYKSTINAGMLVPVVVDEVLPGDTFNFSLTAFARILSPLKYPILDNLYMDFQFFYVPIRLVYEDYEKFFGSSEGQSGNWQYNDTHVMPGISLGNSGAAVGSIFDYMGIPTGIKNLKVNALPFRAYNKIVNDWYLPSSYELSGPVLNVGSTDDNPGDYYLVPRIKRSDYFTTALPAPQRGPGASIGLAGLADIVGDTTNPIEVRQFQTPGVGTSLKTLTLGQVAQSNTLLNVTGGQYASSTDAIGQVSPALRQSGAIYWPDVVKGLKADLTSVSSVSINSLRQAFQLQKLLERDQRGGVFYANILQSHFGVRSPDARLQRSEFLGSGTIPINIHTVANTTGETGGNAQGSLAAFGVAGGRPVHWIKSFTEHGYLIGLCSIRADLTYQQGLPRMFDRWTRFDYFWPVFNCLGEQAILNKEIYAQDPAVVDSDGNSVNELPFGYQERYGEYRYGVSKITGLLRSTASGTLDAWHLAQKFNNLPVLGDAFLEENVPMSRVKADTSAPDFLLDMLVKCNTVRPMSLFGVPGLVDHF